MKLKYIFKTLLLLSFSTQIHAQCLSAYEPNEQRSTAKPFPPSGIITAAIESETDFDYFYFSLASPSNIHIKLYNLTQDFDMVLYNSAGISLATSGTGSNEYIYMQSLPLGTYYIRVFGYEGAYSTDCYSLSFVAGSGACPAAFETDNNSFSTAPNIKFEGPKLDSNYYYKGGAIHNTIDLDFYTVNLSESSTYIFKLHVPVDLKLELFSPSNVLVKGSNNPGTSNEYIHYVCPSSGFYKLKISGTNQAYSQACYTLKYRMFGDFRKEEETAHRNTEAIASQTIKVFPSPSNSNKVVQISGLSSETNLLRIWDMEGILRVTSVITPINGRVSLLMPDLKPGIYLLEAPHSGKVKIILQ